MVGIFPRSFNDLKYEGKTSTRGIFTRKALLSPLQLFAEGKY